MLALSSFPGIQNNDYLFEHNVKYPISPPALKDGSGHVRETLLSLSSINHEIIYDMIGGPLPFVDYVATMQFQPVTDKDTTFACWLAEFSVSDGESDYWEKFVANDVFLGGFRALEQAVKGSN